MSCPANAAAIGLKARIYDWNGVLNGAALNCAEVIQGPFGGATLGATSSSPFTPDYAGGYVTVLSCPAGSVMTGLVGSVGSLWGYTMVQDVSIKCAPIIAGAPTIVGPANGHATNSDITCPAGAVATGLEGHSGALFESVLLKCR